MGASLSPGQPAAREGAIPVGDGALWFREVGQGPPVIVLHGGPDFDCNYLLPELDVLADAYRLIYYDQRGRGRSAANVRPEDVSLASDVEDLKRVRRFVGLETVALLGHSWGGLLALEYAVRHPERVSHLILLNSAFVSADDRLLFMEERRKHEADALDEMREIAATSAFRAGDPATVAAYYRLHYGWTLPDPAKLDALIGRLMNTATPESILRSRAIEDRLLADTWLADGYDLIPTLRQLTIPTVVIHAETDFVPIACVTRIAEAIPGARFVLLAGCGHFSYIERPDAVHDAIDALYAS